MTNTDQTRARVPASFVILMAIIMSASALSIDAMMPALDRMADDLHATYDNQQQLIIMMLFVGMTFGQFVAGPLCDAIGRKKLLMICLGIYSIGAAVGLLAPNMPTMLAGRFIQGLGAAGPFLVAMSVVRDKYAGRAMAKVMSTVMMVFILAPVVAPMIGLGIIWIAGWKAIFAFFIIYAAGVATWVWYGLEETLKPENRVPFRITTILSNFKTVVTHRPTFLYALAMGFVFASFTSFLMTTQQVYQETYGIGDIFVIFFAIQALGFGVSSLINSQIVERFGMSLIVRSALLALITLGAITFLLAQFAHVPFPLFVIFGVLSLFCVGMLFGNLNALAMEAMGAIAATAAAIIGTISNFIAIPLGGMIAQSFDGTLRPIALGFVFLGAMAMLLITLADRAKAKMEK